MKHYRYTEFSWEFIVYVLLNATGTLFIADKNHNRIQKLALSTGMITTAAGTVDVSSGSHT
jgi:hypothetical protein